MAITIEELITNRREFVEVSRKNGFLERIKELFRNIYLDKAHFVYELLQNAEDARAQEARFTLHKDSVEFEHDGKKLFTLQDIDAITSLCDSSKRNDNNNIGKFGVGFKAVFAYTDTPEIESGEYHFRIRDMFVPELDAVSESFSKGKSTRFNLPFNNPKKPADQAVTEIERLLRALGATTLLFLTHIHKIEYRLPDSSLGYIERVDLGDKRFEIRVKNPNDPDPTSAWFLKFAKDVQVEDDEAGSGDGKTKNCRIALAFGLSPIEAKTVTGEAKGSSPGDSAPEWELVRMDPGRVCIYFPAEKETSNLHFHLHAPFASTVTRDSVRDCAGNDKLRDHLAELLAESMHNIRDKGLLDVRTLALLPNVKDNLSVFYKPLMDRLVDEFNRKNLVPLKGEGHGAAINSIRGEKSLTDIIDDSDLVVLLGDSETHLRWTANPPLKHQREDHFLCMLNIRDWSETDFVSTLCRMNPQDRTAWMVAKNDKWHQRLYSFLYPHSEALQDLDIVCVSDQTYLKGSDCFFPTEEVEHDKRFPRVAKGVLFKGKKEIKDVRDFLQNIGVRELDEWEEIKYILKTYYTENAKKPYKKEHFRHLKRFIRYLKDNDKRSTVFRDYYIFMTDNTNDIEWHRPEHVYLRKPFLDTGLDVYYDTLKDSLACLPLWSGYNCSSINNKDFVKFTVDVGVIKTLIIKEDIIRPKHPDYQHFLTAEGNTNKFNKIDRDFKIVQLTKFLTLPSLEKSRLLWRTMKDIPVDYLEAVYQRNKICGPKTGPSTLVCELREAKWIPQENGIEESYHFVEPYDAHQDLLPAGFDFDKGWKWLNEIGFAQGNANKPITNGDKKPEDGLEQEEEEKISKWKKEKPEEFKQLLHKISNHPQMEFTTKSVKNTKRREDKVIELYDNALDKDFKSKPGTIRDTRRAIDPRTRLRVLYTNSQKLMICQICKEEMPFRKRNKEHYFEIREVLSRKYLPKELEAQYLALCPICAAKYSEYVINDDGAMRQLKNDIISADLKAEELDIPIQLDMTDAKPSISFVQEHLFDLQLIIKKSHRY